MGIDYARRLDDIAAMDKPVAELAGLLELPDTAVKALRELEGGALPSACCDGAISAVLRDLTDSAQAEGAWQTLRRLLNVDAGGDPEGWKTLYVMLFAAARYSWQRYVIEGMSADVFVATMKAFSRFVGENRIRFGRVLFDRAFWTWRQLSLRLFRLGTLEFETVEGAEVPSAVRSSTGARRAVSVHIPSDADLRAAAVDESLAAWDDFAASHRRDWSQSPLYCESWLLASALAEILPPSSRIVGFQRRFRIVAENPDALDWREWIFDCNPAPIPDLPGDTSLRRAVKEHLMQGGNLANAMGVLR